MLETAYSAKAEEDMEGRRNVSLAARIRDARIRVGLSQAELARRCGISPSLLCNLENGKIKSLRHSTLLQMAVEVGKSPEWIALGNVKAAPVKAHVKLEQELLSDFRRLSTAERMIVARMVRSLVMDKRGHRTRLKPRE